MSTKNHSGDKRGGFVPLGDGAAFKDTWTLSDVDVEWINLIEAKHPALYRVLLAAMTSSDKSYLAYMSVRLLELRRVLKPTGSLSCIAIHTTILAF